MKKKYEKPKIEVIHIETENVISASNNDPWGPGGQHENCKPGDHNHKSQTNLRTNFYNKY